jgi:hypothetical protein
LLVSAADIAPAQKILDGTLTAALVALQQCLTGAGLFAAGVVMEIEDSAYPLVRGVVATTNLDGALQRAAMRVVGRRLTLSFACRASEATKDVDYAVLVGGFPRKDGMTRGDLLNRNSCVGDAKQRCSCELTQSW